MRRVSSLIDRATEALGHPTAVAMAFAVVIAWMLGLPHFGVQDANYQLLINTGTTIVTFVMVFCVQHTQNKDASATQLKLDELIRSVQGARDNVAGIERDDELLKKEKSEAVATATAASNARRTSRAPRRPRRGTDHVARPGE